MTPLIRAKLGVNQRHVGVVIMPFVKTRFGYHSVVTVRSTIEPRTPSTHVSNWAVLAISTIGFHSSLLLYPSSSSPTPKPPKKIQELFNSKVKQGPFAPRSFVCIISKFSIRVQPRQSPQPCPFRQLDKTYMSIIGGQAPPRFVGRGLKISSRRGRLFLSLSFTQVEF